MGTPACLEIAGIKLTDKRKALVRPRKHGDLSLQLRYHFCCQHPDFFKLVVSWHQVDAKK